MNDAYEHQDTPPEAADSAGHAGDLALMLAADGESPPPALAAHLEKCESCRSRLEAFRREATELGAKLALDAAETALLLSADVPGAVARHIEEHRRALAAARRRAALDVAAVFVTALVTYLVWLRTQPVLASGFGLLRQAGLVTLAVDALANWVIQVVAAVARAVVAFGALPGAAEPALPLAGLALITWLALASAQSRAPRAAGHGV